MNGATFERLAQSLARGGPRRWALKSLAAGALGAGMLGRGTGASDARDADDAFQRCLDSCRSSCTNRCPSRDECAASCSHSQW